MKDKVISVSALMGIALNTGNLTEKFLEGQSGMNIDMTQEYWGPVIGGAVGAFMGRMLDTNGWRGAVVGGAVGSFIGAAAMSVLR